MAGEDLPVVWTLPPVSVGHSGAGNAASETLLQDTATVSARAPLHTSHVLMISRVRSHQLFAHPVDAPAGFSGVGGCTLDAHSAQFTAQGHTHEKNAFTRLRTIEMLTQFAEH